MNKISTLLLAVACATPIVGRAEVKSSTVEIKFHNQYAPESYDGDISKYFEAKKNQPGELLGTWTSGEGAFKYDTETGHYFIENFLDCEGATLEFYVGDEETTAPKVVEWKSNPNTFCPERYDFNIVYQTKSTATTGLKFAELKEGLIQPYTATKRHFTISGKYAVADTYIPGKFYYGDNSYYQFISVAGNPSQPAGFCIYTSNPQSLAASTGGTGGTGGTTGGSEAGSSLETAESFVTKDGDNYTVYLHFAPASINHAYWEKWDNGQYAGENKLDCHYLVFSFNKDLAQTGIDNIAVDAEDANAPVEYFNLQGVRVENPTNGLYIRRQGKTVSKVIL